MNTNRRQFLKQSARRTLAGAAPVVLASRLNSANDRLTYGLIGAGERGRYLNQVFQRQGCQSLAICDVYQPNAERASADSPGAKVYVDYKDLLAHGGIDFVVVASPDHHHYSHLVDSLAAGKDVYLEKPISRSVEESGRMIEAVRRTDRIVQVGMQRRSANVVLQARSLVQQGVLGKLAMIRPMWKWNVAKELNNSPLPGKLDWKRFLGTAQDRPLEPRRFRYWRFFWDYAGGPMTDQGTHLMDVAQWLSGTTAPLSAACIGQTNKTSGSEMADVFSAVFEYPRHLVTWTLDYCNSYQNGWSIEFNGDAGTLLMSEEGFQVYREPWARPENRTPAHEMRETVPVEPHVQNFLECIRSRKQPNATIEVGASAVCGPHLANLAMLQGRRVLLDAAGDLRKR